LGENSNFPAKSVIPFARTPGTIGFIRRTDDFVHTALDKTSDELGHAIPANDMTTWHSSGFIFHANLILFIGDNEARDLIEITFGLDDFGFGALNHFVGRKKFIILDFDTCVVNFGGDWV
jgi:hypothetical protein